MWHFCEKRKKKEREKLISANKNQWYETRGKPRPPVPQQVEFTWID
jgi:hypothetical protein